LASGSIYLPLHCDDKVVAGAHHNILGILVTQIEDIHVIDLDHRIAGLEASLLGQAAGVHLEKIREKQDRLVTITQLNIDLPWP